MLTIKIVKPIILIVSKFKSGGFLWMQHLKMRSTLLYRSSSKRGNSKSFVGGTVEVPVSTLGFSITESRVNDFVKEMETAMKASQLIDKIIYRKDQSSAGTVAAFIIS